MFLRSQPLTTTLSLLLLLSISTVQSIDQSRKLDESIDQSKCGGCPCGNPCTTPTYPPPPPPPPLLPPPPPPKKTPSTGGYCPPPPLPPSPPSGFIYITGPPGSLYPVDQSYNGAAGGDRSFAVALWTGLVAVLILFHQF